MPSEKELNVNLLDKNKADTTISAGGFMNICNCSVPSQLQAKIYAKSPSVMNFCLLNSRFLTVSAVNALTC